MNDQAQIPTFLASDPKADAARAKDTAGVMDRDEMQVEAHLVESLLGAAMAMLGSRDDNEVFELLEMAVRRTNALNNALDSLHVDEEAA